LNLHNNALVYRPPTAYIPLIQKLKDAYKLWQEFLKHFPKTTKYTLGEKIDSSFLEAIEFVFTASYLSKQQKRPFVQRVSSKIDLLKLFLQIAWEVKSLNNKKYIALSEKLDEIGRMLGGWNKQLSE
tara:strand:- start:550 stop:930 length:381 start_codon:yes stop_codon:yes gene_type:complete